MAWHWAKIEEVNSIMGIDFYVKLISHLSRQLLDSQTLNWGGDSTVSRFIARVPI